MALIFPAAGVQAKADEPGQLIVTRSGDACLVKPKEGAEARFKHQRPARAIEWALKNAPVVLVDQGQYSVRRSIMIPRSNVSLVIGPGATIGIADGANLEPISEGHGKYSTLIHNRGRDHVGIINLGTLRNQIQRGACIMFNGRNDGEVGIHGGLIFSSGVLAGRGDAIWVVDSAGVRIPLVAAKRYGNNLMAMEGTEDVTIGVAAGLAGGGARENEATDLNSYCERIRFDRLIGTSPSEQILDINNSLNVEVDEITGYRRPDDEKFRSTLYKFVQYGKGGRRLTQKPYIPESRNVIIRSARVAKQKVGNWTIETNVENPDDSLPQLRVRVRLIGNPGGDESLTVLDRRYLIDLSGRPWAARYTPDTLMR